MRRAGPTPAQERHRQAREDLRESVADASVGTAPEAWQPENTAATSLALFLARLSGPLPGRLPCLEMQDHDLAVHTTGGTDMVLCRMEDAARELDGIANSCANANTRQWSTSWRSSCRHRTPLCAH